MGAAMFALAGAAHAQTVEEKIVETLDTLSGGPHEGYRANHAKGVVARGTFEPTAEAAAISKAAHFAAEVPVLVRFSNGTGVPDLPDTSPAASPHGMAIRFELGQDDYTDIVAISYNGFPVATPEDFLGLLSAVAASGPDAPEPKPIAKFLDSHPAAKTFATAPKPAPVSFATLPFYGVNAFAFANAAGETVHGRYQILPTAGDQRLTEAETAEKGPDYLMEELPARLTEGPVSFRLALQIAQDGDSLTDPTQVWPDGRRVVELGTITLDQAVADSYAVAKPIMFDPLALTDGIDATDDPVLLARPGAYAISYSRRAE
jgi:catalase